MLVRFSIVAVVLATLLVPRPARAQLTVTEIPNVVKIIYIDGAQSFLVPHAARTFLNSLAFQKKLFDFTPTEEITVLLLDFQDSGNASATRRAAQRVMVQAAPLSFAFETIAGNDRLNIIMNHELVHVATMDQAARAGSVLPRALRRQGDAARRSTRIDSLFLPDDSARRGAAVVPRRHRGLPRHVDGRRSRAGAERV